MQFEFFLLYVFAEFSFFGWEEPKWDGARKPLSKNFYMYV